MQPTNPFALHPRLEADTAPVADGPLSTFRLMNDARFPWLILVPRKPDLVEISDLDVSDRALLVEEAVCAANAIKAVTGVPRTNTASLGNQVPQLHVHVIGRRPDDAAWPGPVWGVGETQSYGPAAMDDLIAALAKALD